MNRAIAAGTNDHKWSGFKQSRLYFWRSQVLKSRCQQGCVHSGGSRREPTVLLFSQLLEVTRIPWFTVPPFILNRIQQHSIFKYLTLILLPPSHKESWDYIWPAQPIQDTHTI